MVRRWGRGDDLMVQQKDREMGQKEGEPHKAQACSYHKPNLLMSVALTVALYELPSKGNGVV